MNRNILKKLGAVALSALMTLGVASQGISTVEAFTTHVDYDGKSTAYGSTCGKFRINGRQAWCLEHAKKTPGSQDMNAEIYTSTEAKYANIRKIMYYGWFGYEEWSGLHGKSDNEKNVIMSKALSHAYSGSSISKGIMTDFYNYATSKPDPLHQNNLVFSKHVVNTWYDQNAKIQKSESSRLNGPSGYHITINTQTNRVKVVNETRGWAGQVVDVYGGDTVHYEADAGYTGHAYSGYLQGGFTFAPLIAYNGNSKQQQIGTWLTVDPGVNTFLNADFRAQLGSLKLRKTDTGGKLLDGAVFHVSGNGYEKDVTVTNGEITVNELPIGDYTITEKTAPNGYLVNVAPFKATVSAGQTAETTITDEAPTGKISIKKSDSKGNVQGEASLEGAEYTVYGADGQEVGKITTDKDGNGSLENLVLGTYTVKETKAPEAYDLDWNTYTVELTYKDQNTAIILGNVDSKENVKTGKIEIKKTDTEGNPLKSGEFGIYANADMYIGDTLYKKGQLVVSIKTDDSGVARSGDLPYGSYYVKEISAPTQEAGNSHNFVLSNDTQYVKINGKNKTDTVTFVDKKVTASKTTITGTDEIKGAVMTVTDNDGKVIDTWTSDGNPHSIKGLHEGWEYTLTETTAPKGYVKAESIKFTVSTDKKDQTIVMKDKQFTASKKDVSGKNYVEGAKLEVRDDQNRVVDSWTSTKEDHYVSGLEEGKTYRLVEAEAPKGYVKAKDVFFTVSNEKKNESVVMKDAKITASKTEVTGTKEVEGAKMTVTDEKGKTVDEWTSGKEEHSISGLEEGKKYTLIETTAPKGYVKAESIEFTAGDKDQKLVMKDKQVTVTKTEVSGTDEVEGAKMTVTDEKGKTVDEWTSGKEEHYVSGLEEGKTYTLTETTAPNGYVKAESIEFTVSKDKVNQKVNMLDKQISVTKTDITGTQEVPGATLTVKDADGNTVDTWVSGEKEHYVSGLEEGKTYTLIEETAPEGYVRADEITFTVTKEKVDQEVNMFDAQVKVTKTDALTGDAVKGAEFTVFDKDGNIVDKWTTDGTAHAVSGLDAGCEYILKETKTPEGYMTAPDRTLVVSGEQNMDVEIKEHPVLTDIEVQKVDAQTKKVIRSKDFEFTMYSDAECKNAITTVSADKNAGTATFKDLRYGTYYIKETKAPTGYLLSKEVKKVVIDDNLENVGKTYSFVYQDTPMPTTGVKTGDGTDIKKFTALTGISGIVLLICVILIIRKKRNDQ
ncbi:SpaA isopeptide-forming pilin-related protein [Catenibacterium sp.]|uniref:SpaA isopeptide-forming pilin-related protein n=3 Tax=Catenibacterium sp. TaxID=2049022 RepID=UPI003FD8B846